MPLITDNSQNKILEKNNINIKTKYIVGNSILERNTNGSTNDDIKSGIRCKKEYYYKDKLVGSIDKFDSRIEYTFISKELEDKDYICPNCGNHSTLHEFTNGCPYCGTNYNMDYIDKSLSGKYHYDRILRSTKYRVITAIVDIIISLIVSYIFITSTARTFNSYDISKIFIYGGILSLILYYFFYIIDGYIVLGPIKAYKDSLNEKQKEFWNKTNLDKKTFFNKLNYEVGKKYFNNSNIIDYDILDYDGFNDYTIDKTLNVEVKAYVRIVRFINNKLRIEYLVDTYTMKRNNIDVLTLDKDVNIIKCSNCGSSIDATKGKCEFCNQEIKPIQEWVMIDNKEN